MEPAIFDVVIFSRDRACQLDLLLRSVKRFLADYESADVTVLYGFSTKDDDRAYNVVRAEHRAFRYVCEADHTTGWRELALELVSAERDVLVLTDEVVLAAPLVAADVAQSASGLSDRLNALDLDAPRACGDWVARLAPGLLQRAEFARGADPVESLNVDFLAGRRLSLDALVAAEGPAPLVWEEHGDEDPTAAPRVSVVVPCFDCGEFLTETVESVLTQTLREFEVIIVDDGSHDDSVAVAERLIAAHPDVLIRLLRQRNAGHPSYTRNTGVFHARGEYVLCLDGDDLLTPTFLEKCVAALDAHPEVSVAYADQRHFGATSRHIEVHDWDFGRLIHHNMLGIASVFRRSAWEDVGGFDAHMRYEDWDFWIACGAHGHHGMRVAGTEWLYRTRSNGRYTTGGARQDRRTKAILVSKRPELYTPAQRDWATAVLAQDPAADQVEDRLGEIPRLDAFPPAPAPAAERGSGVAPASPALAAARSIARATGAMLLPVDASVPADAGGAILLVDHTPSDETLGALAAALPRATALVLWAPGWDEPTTVDSLGRHGFEHGTVQIIDDPELGALAVLTATEAAAKAISFPSDPERRFRALAVLPAFNEEDVIFHAIGALVSEGVDVYLIDHNSTDGTAAAARPWLGRGLVRIERFPDDAGYPERNRHEMVWRDILRRVQDVSGQVAADWYMFVNADEFREAPWPGVTLGDALREVDELGFSAVNFELFDFRPVDDAFQPGDDPRRRLRHYDRPGRHDVLQIKAWKRQPQPVDLVTHGGHDVLFEGKRVFPVPFILRHYPIRSSEHGARKVLGERLPRFASEERADGWHVQYDGYVDRASFLHDPATLTEWDSVRVRADLLSSRLRELLLALCLGGVDATRGEVRVGEIQAWLDRRSDAGTDEAALRAAQERLAAAASGVELVPAQELDSVARDLSLALAAHARLAGNPLAAASMLDARDRLSRA